MRRPSTTSVSPSTVTGRPSRPEVESKASRRARACGSARSFTATTSSLLSRSSRARRTLRPMRPNPLMAMRVMPLACFLPEEIDRGWRATVRKNLATAGEGAAVLARRGAEDALEVQAQVRTGAEADVRGDLLDAALRPLEQLAGHVDAGAQHPLHRRGPGVLEETPGEGARRDGGVPGEDLEGERLVEAVQ